MGPARLYAIVFGVTYLAVAALEVVLAATGSKIAVGTFVLFQAALLQNIVHWAVGLVVVASFLMGEARARLVARLVGVVFVLVSVLGIVARDFTGKLLGFHGALPWSYNIVHVLTAVAALAAGFLYLKETAAAQSAAPARRTV